ncbi:potassium-transporting ATPase subunit KdpC [Legionella sp. D16C41]|uniref:potassium-transporting ATPase subunit KdpC n=1 Tax=Legionella sp. D16C41 TaxID=3402688 RepID=UPI003AF5990F
MLKEVAAQLKIASIFLLIFLILTGLIYPLVVTAVAQLLFPVKANGSLIKQNDTLIGSHLIGQFFSHPTYFWGRPSATMPYPYNGAASSGSNLGPTNPHFLAQVRERINFVTQTQSGPLIPVDLVTASGSGLDPDISPHAAYFQAARIAKARNLPLETIQNLIKQHIQYPTLGFLGETRVNVLELNLALDNLRDTHGQATLKP